MREVILRPGAEADIEDIAAYTIAQWGRDQARLYLGDLRRTMERLASDPQRHPAADRVLPGLRKVRSGHHIVFFLIEPDHIDVLRVLHERMDLAGRMV